MTTCETKDRKRTEGETDLQMDPACANKDKAQLSTLIASSSDFRSNFNGFKIRAEETVT